jgi:hypothetical protein
MTYMIQIDDVIRPATFEEIKIIETQQAEAIAIKQNQLDKEIARQSAISKLSALGLTESEINALIGGN